MRTILLVMGTRPEIIKLAPVYTQLARQRNVRVEIFWSGQHVELAEGLAELFGLEVDHFGSDLMSCTSLAEKFGVVIEDVADLLSWRRYDWVVVQGDTMTAAAGATAGFLNRVPVAHVEAGLRTRDLQAPWPEAVNRRIVALCTKLHFPPTEEARRNLLAERFDERTMVVTGNTVIDALEYVRRLVRFDYTPRSASIGRLPADKKLILVTGHRRENAGVPLLNIIAALRELATDGDKCIVYPVHLNPDVQHTVYGHLSGAPNVHLIEPLQYPDFVYLMERAWTLVTDSGGIQEEAPSFHRPIVITRETTERPEVVTAGFGRLVGSDTARLVATVREFTRGAVPDHNCR